jgi:DNA replication protein DnaC
VSAAAAPAAAPTLLDLYLKQLGLPAMARAYPAVVREATAERHDYLQFLLALCGYEIEQRQRNQLARRLKQAQFPWPKTLDEFDFGAVPALKPAAVLQLADGAFVRERGNLLVLGGPGVGKTHLLIGLGRALCQAGFRVLFKPAAPLVAELLAAQAEHRLHRLLKLWRRVDLIVIDELGYIPFSTAGAQALFQFFADRHELASVAISSNLEFGRWNEIFGDERMTAALLDRLTHRGHVLVIEGESYRLKESLRRQAAAPSSK